jgi:hypothetical protein
MRENFTRVEFFRHAINNCAACHAWKIQFLIEVVNELGLFIGKE